jgi:hypothetical protein
MECLYSSINKSIPRPLTYQVLASKNDIRLKPEQKLSYLYSLTFFQAKMRIRDRFLPCNPVLLSINIQHGKERWLSEMLSYFNRGIGKGNNITKPGLCLRFIVYQYPVDAALRFLNLVFYALAGLVDSGQVR